MQNVVRHILAVQYEHVTHLTVTTNHKVDGLPPPNQNLLNWINPQSLDPPINGFSMLSGNNKQIQNQPAG